MTGRFAICLLLNIQGAPLPNRTLVFLPDDPVKRDEILIEMWKNAYWESMTVSLKKLIGQPANIGAVPTIRLGGLYDLTATDGYIELYFTYINNIGTIHYTNNLPMLKV